MPYYFVMYCAQAEAAPFARGNVQDLPGTPVLNVS